MNARCVASTYASCDMPFVLTRTVPFSVMSTPFSFRLHGVRSGMEGRERWRGDRRLFCGGDALVEHPRDVHPTSNHAGEEGEGLQQHSNPVSIAQLAVRSTER
jgi:hypothetical protein